MKKVLVLGGNGFIGRNLVTFLKKEPYEVYSFDLTEPKEQQEGVTYLSGDFFDDYVLQNIVSGKDIIYHTICTLNPGNSNDKFVMGYERDLIQTMKLCNIIKSFGTKMIFLSSGGTVYGRQEVLPIVEDSLPVPINHYGNLKLCIENTLRVFNYQEHTDYKIARISNPYGPGQDYRKGVGFIDAVIKRAIANEPVEVWGEGNAVRDYIYIDDVCKMLVLMGKEDIAYEVVNVSSGRGISQKNVIAAVKKHCPKLQVEYKSARTVDADKVVLSNERICQSYGNDLVSFEEGIEKYYEYCKMNEK